METNKQPLTEAQKQKISEITHRLHKEDPMLLYGSLTAIELISVEFAKPLLEEISKLKEDNESIQLSLVDVVEKSCAKVSELEQSLSLSQKENEELKELAMIPKLVIDRLKKEMEAVVMAEKPLLKVIVDLKEQLENERQSKHRLKQDFEELENRNKFLNEKLKSK